MKILNVLRVLAYVYMFTVIELMEKAVSAFCYGGLLDGNSWIEMCLSGDIINVTNWVKICLTILPFVIVAILACIVINVSAVKSKGTKTFSVVNLIAKIWHLHIHVKALSLAKDMFIIIWVTLSSWIPLAISLFLLLFSGIANVGTCVNLYRNKQCKLPSTIILSIMGFIYGLDIIGGIIQLICSFKKKGD